MAESRLIKAQKNVITGILLNILNIFLTFISRRIFVRILDVGYLGINGLFSNVLNILSMADLGIATAMMYSLYKPLAESDTKKIGALVTFFRKIYLIIAGVVLGVGLAVVPFLNYIVNLETPIPYLEGYYLLALLNVVISYLFVYRTTLLAADQKSYILNKYTMIFKVITFLVQILVLLVCRNYFFYLLAALISSFASNLYQNMVAIRMYPYLKARSFGLEKQEKQDIGRNVKATFIYKISGTIQNNTDNILISVFVGTVFVGYYSNYAMVVAAIVSIINLVFTSLKAGIGNLIADKDMPQKQRWFLFRVLELINFWIVAFCSVCFICLFQDFIGGFFGMKYVLEFSVVVAAVLNFYTSNIRQTVWTFRETTGLFHETRYITTVTAVINIILSLIFGYYWGMVGIILATVISRMVFAWWREPQILFRKVFNESAKEYYITYIKRICLCIVVCAVTYGICNAIIITNNYVCLTIKLLVCCIIPNAVFLMCYSKTPEFEYIYKNMIKVIKHKF